MSKHEVKELIVFIIFSVLNTIIAFSITSFLGISNTIVFRTFTAMYGDITWEVIIFMGLSFIEAIIYECGNYSYTDFQEKI